MALPFVLARAAVDYVRANPIELARVARNATRLKLGLPVGALRALASAAAKAKGPKDVSIEAVPPGLRLGATLDLMKTPVRATATLRVEEIRVSEAELRFALRVRDIRLDLVTESESPIAALLKSGALDLSRPGDLVKFLPNRSPALVEAEGDLIVVDLMKLPRVGEHKAVRRALSLVTPVLGVRAIETDREHFYVALRATPSALPAVLAAAIAG